VSAEGLTTHPVPDIPQFSESVAAARHERAMVGSQRQRHDVSRVAGVRLHLLARLHVPQRARHVAGRRDDLVVVEKPAAGEISLVAGQLTRHSHVSLPGLEAVDGADIVETATGHVGAGGRVGTCHDPGGPEWDGVHFVS